MNIVEKLRDRGLLIEMSHRNTAADEIDRLRAALQECARALDALDPKGGKLAHPPAAVVIASALSAARAAIPDLMY